MNKSKTYLLALSLIGSPFLLHGADYQWNFPATGALWSTGENWTPAGVPNAGDANILFNRGSAASASVTLDGNYTVGNMRLTADGGRTLSIISSNVNGSYSLNITGSLTKSNNSNNVQFHNENTGRSLHLTIQSIDYDNNAGGGFYFGRTDGGRTLSSLSIGSITLGSGNVVMNVASDYSLGHITLLRNEAKVISLTNTGTGSVQTRVATVKGITQTTGSNAVIEGSKRESIAGQKNVGTLRIDVDSGQSYTASTLFRDGEGGVLNVLKAGGGTQVLGGEHSYTGSTIVEEGKLVQAGAFTTTGKLDVFNQAVFGVHNAVAFNEVRLEGGAVIEFNLEADGTHLTINDGLSRLGVGLDGFIINFDNTGIVGKHYDGIITLVGGNDFQNAVIRYVNFGSESLSGEFTFEQLTNGFSVAIPEPSSYGIAGAVAVFMIVARALRRRDRAGCKKG